MLNPRFGDQWCIKLDLLTPVVGAVHDKGDAGLFGAMSAPATSRLPPDPEADMEQERCRSCSLCAHRRAVRCAHQCACNGEICKGTKFPGKRATRACRWQDPGVLQCWGNSRGPLGTGATRAYPAINLPWALAVDSAEVVTPPHSAKPDVHPPMIIGFWPCRCCHWMWTARWTGVKSCSNMMLWRWRSL